MFLLCVLLYLLKVFYFYHIFFLPPQFLPLQVLNPSSETKFFTDGNFLLEGCKRLKSLSSTCSSWFSMIFACFLKALLNREYLIRLCFIIFGFGARSSLVKYLYLSNLSENKV